MSSSKTAGAGVGRYLKEAFLFRWNLLLFLGGAAASLLTPWPDVVFPLVAAGEITYLAGLISFPKFQRAIDAKARRRGKSDAASTTQAKPLRSIREIVESLPLETRARFEKLHSRCLEMRKIAHGVTGRTGSSDEATEDIRTPALNRLLWVFLRLLVSQNALTRFLETTSEEAIRDQLSTLREHLAAAQAREEGGDERIIRSLQDSVVVNELRLDNYEKATGNAEFVGIELDRIESKIRVLTEMSVNRQDPNFISSQVDSVAESMRQTEQAISELQLITGLRDDLEEPPSILESDLREVLRSEA